MQITQRIFELLKKQNKKQSELAEYIGISRAAISDWKGKGTTPTAEYLVKICEFFDVTLDYLLKGDLSEIGSVNVAGNVSGGSIGINSGIVAQGEHSTATAVYGLSNEESDILKIYRDFDFDRRLEFLKMLSELKKK